MAIRRRERIEPVTMAFGQEIGPTARSPLHACEDGGSGANFGCLMQRGVRRPVAALELPARPESLHHAEERVVRPPARHCPPGISKSSGKSALIHRPTRCRAVFLAPDMSLERRDTPLTWHSDGKWAVMYLILVTLFVLSWAYIPA
jgi:hypothetical protein